MKYRLLLSALSLLTTNAYALDLELAKEKSIHCAAINVILHGISKKGKDSEITNLLNKQTNKWIMVSAALFGVDQKDNVSNKLKISIQQIFTEITNNHQSTEKESPASEKLVNHLNDCGKFYKDNEIELDGYMVKFFKEYKPAPKQDKSILEMTN